VGHRGAEVVSAADGGDCGRGRARGGERRAAQLVDRKTQRCDTGEAGGEGETQAVGSFSDFLASEGTCTADSIMSYDVRDTIVAIASAAGGAARGIVRLSGPATVECVARCFAADDATDACRGRSPRRCSGSIAVEGDGAQTPVAVPCDVVLWPGVRSYTRQPAAEIHTLGSPPLLAAVVAQLLRCGARAALPGEFTLRAFLAGRIDLVQAEAVLGVIDAAGSAEFDGALDQLAGGLSQPLHRVRGRLLDALAELEAGLDFAEEDIEFIDPEALVARIDDALRVLRETRVQLAGRDLRSECPLAILAGAANAGKSSLFNALVARFGAAVTAPAIVSPIAGATRDYLTATLNLDGVVCKLVDAAGDADATDLLAQRGLAAAAAQRRSADVRLWCLDAGSSDARAAALPTGPRDLVVWTKIDLALPPRGEAGHAACSSATGQGVAELAAQVRQLVVEGRSEPVRGGAAATAARCADALVQSERALDAARLLADADAGPELVAAELRDALQHIGHVVGAVCADDVLDRVFSQFCIGK